MELHPPEPVDSWAERQAYWVRKFRRLRLDAEPIEEQLARQKRVTWALTVVSSIIALMFIALFAAFRRPDLGLLFDLMFFGPILLFAWFDYEILQRDASAYLAERGKPPKTELDDLA